MKSDLTSYQQDLKPMLALESYRAKARKEFFSRLDNEMQVNLIISATDCYARSSNHGSIEQALNEMLDLIVTLND